jgi:hypothetical protein
VPKPPVFSGAAGSGGGKPGGLGKYFDKALYYFENPYRSSSGILPPSSPKADLNNLTASATAPTHRRSYNSKVGGYYSFRTASSQYFSLASDVTDAQSEVFIAALVRVYNGGVFHVGRGADGSGNGWSIIMESRTADCTSYALTTSTGNTTQSAATSGLVSGRWTLVTYAYKSGSYIKVGKDGSWHTTSAFAATTLRSSTVGLSIGKANSASTGSSNCECAFVGIGTSIPTDKQLRYIHWAIRNGVELPPPAGDTNPPPGDDPGDGNSGVQSRILLLGVG